MRTTARQGIPDSPLDLGGSTHGRRGSPRFARNGDRRPAARRTRPPPTPKGDLRAVSIIAIVTGAIVIAWYLFIATVQTISKVDEMPWIQIGMWVLAAVSFVCGILSLNARMARELAAAGFIAGSRRVCSRSRSASSANCSTEASAGALRAELGQHPRPARAVEVDRAAIATGVGDVEHRVRRRLGDDLHIDVGRHSGRGIQRRGLRDERGAVGDPAPTVSLYSWIMRCCRGSVRAPQAATVSAARTAVHHDSNRSTGPGSGDAEAVAVGVGTAVGEAGAAEAASTGPVSDAVGPVQADSTRPAPRSVARSSGRGDRMRPSSDRWLRGASRVRRASPWNSRTGLGVRP